MRSRTTTSRSGSRAARAWGIRTRAISILVASALSACATPEALNEFHSRQIDRPYVLPEGIAAWETWVMASQSVSPDNVNENWPLIPNPFILRHSIGKKWNLIWYLLPLGAQYEILRDDTTTLGASLLIHEFGYGSVQGLLLSASTSLLLARKLRDDLALRSMAVISHDGSRAGYSLAFSPLFQLGDPLALGVVGGVSLHQSAFHYFGTEVPIAKVNPYMGPQLALGFVGEYSFSSRFSIGAEYLWQNPIDGAGDRPAEGFGDLDSPINAGVLRLKLLW